MAVRASIASIAVMLTTSACCLSVISERRGSTGIGSTIGTTSSGTTGSTGGSTGGAGTTTTGTSTGATRLGVGPCTSNDQCLSGVCGTDGTGHCCSAACASVAPPCGATDCDGLTGACVYPGASVACGGSLACSGDTLNHASVCDGAGECTPSATSCAPYVCEDAGCLTACQTSAECAGGFFCDSLNAVCCSGLSAGGTIGVDSDRGDDGHACCGIGENQPCQTLTQSMKLIDSAQARDVTIRAAVSFDGGLWDKDGTETYPIVLGWGAELKAPGVSFNVLDFYRPNVPAEIFDIDRYSPSDTVGYASLTGASGLVVALYSGQTAVQVESGSHLYLANAYLLSNVGINVLPLASLTLGQDRSDAATGTVTIGQIEFANGFDLGGYGLTCFSDDAGNGCTIDDATLDGESSVIIRNQVFADIWAEDGTSISLTSSPIIGLAPSALGFQQCPSDADTTEGPGPYAAVYLQGMATMDFKNGTVQCIQHVGFGLSPSPIGSPSLTIENSVIQNTSMAIVVAGGSLTVANSAIRFNAYGVEVEGDAGADLSGGSLGGRNTIACNFGDAESGGGGSVVNFSSNSVNASNVAWDTAGPNLFVCSDAGVCTCADSDCTALSGPGVVKDAISFPPYAGINTTGHTLSPLNCE